MAAALLCAYAAGARRERRRGRSWSSRRTTSFAVGVVLLAGAWSTPVEALAAADFRAHVGQHLVIGMFAPLALALSAPMTLALRTVPRPARRRLTPALRSRAAHAIAHPAAAVTLNLAGLYALYLTPLYAAAAGGGPVHAAVHAHFLVAGYLLAWSIAGADPVPGRPGLGVRAAALLAASAGHAVLAKTLYAHGLPEGGGHGAGELRGGAQLMYYGGDVAEVLVAVALLLAWRRGRVRAEERAWSRRIGPAHGAG